MNINFSDIQSVKELNQYHKFLLGLNLGYKGYDDWTFKAKCEIDSGYKDTIIIKSENQIGGGVIFQKHKTLDRVKEIKNIRIHPKLRGRGLTRCAVAQAEYVDKELYDIIMVDAPKGQEDISNFLMAIGYSPIIDINLYDKNNQDIVFIKSTNAEINNNNLLLIKNYIVQKATMCLKDF